MCRHAVPAPSEGTSGVGEGGQVSGRREKRWKGRGGKKTGGEEGKWGRKREREDAHRGRSRPRYRGQLTVNYILITFQFDPLDCAIKRARIRLRNCLPICSFSNIPQGMRCGTSPSRLTTSLSRSAYFPKSTSQQSSVHRLYSSSCICPHQTRVSNVKHLIVLPPCPCARLVQRQVFASLLVCICAEPPDHHTPS